MKNYPTDTDFMVFQKKALICEQFRQVLNQIEQQQKLIDDNKKEP